MSAMRRYRERQQQVRSSAEQGDHETRNHEPASEKPGTQDPISPEHCGEASAVVGRARFAVDRLAVGGFRGDSAQPVSAIATGGGKFVH